MLEYSEGEVKKGMTIEMMNTKKKFEVTEVGVMAPHPTELDSLQAGDVGYIAASIKDIRSCHVGDTITDASRPTEEALPGYKKLHQWFTVVFIQVKVKNMKMLKMH